METKIIYSVLKIKDLVVLKKKNSKERKQILNIIKDLRDKKQEYLIELEKIHNNWKDTIKELKILENENKLINQTLREKKISKKRVNCDSGLTINIKHKIKESILTFLTLQDKETVSRVDVMNQILSYIKKHDLYSENDKRYIAVNKPESNKILSLFDIQTTETLFRIQHFRKFLETNIKNNLKEI